ncbi:MAG: hypothetical protein ACYTXT_39145 [Nostoc sp.]
MELSDGQLNVPSLCGTVGIAVVGCYTPAKAKTLSNRIAITQYILKMFGMKKIPKQAIALT